MPTPRLASAAVALVLTAGGVLGLAGTASAAPSPGYDPNPQCLGSGSYPTALGQGAGRGLSDTDLDRLEAARATSGCVSFAPGTSVAFRIVSASRQFPLGNAVANAGGNVSTDFRTPECIEDGSATFEFTAAGTTVSIPFTVSGGSTEGCVGVLNAAGDFVGQGNGQTRGEQRGNSGAVGPRSRVAGVLPRTGDDTLIPLGIAGAVMVASGGAVVAAARRRREQVPGSIA